MTGRDQQDPPAPPSENVSDLVNHYRAQKDAWREWESQIEKLHHQILTAAERRAATIVTTARADIRRILVEARRDLLDLTSHVREVTGGQEDRSVRGETAPVHAPETGQWSRDDAGAKKETVVGDIHDRLLSARHDVRRLLDEARPALERLSEEALPPRQPPEPKPEEARTSTFVAERSIWAEAASVAEARPPASAGDASDAHTSRGDGDGTREGRSKKILIALASVVAAAILLGLAWWLRPERVPLELPVTQAAAAPAAAAPATAPATAAPATAAPVQPSPSPAVNKTPPPPPAAAAPGSLVIIVEARREAWIQSTIDGKADAGRLYPAGETRRIDGARSIRLRVGDAGAVTVSVNGKNAEILGQDGRIVTRRYGADDEPLPPATPGGER
ncbi:MAG: DUF4115 domain-containing protein [Vicinamibacterales bacterium]